jgi:hypothetical protein
VQFAAETGGIADARQIIDSIDEDVVTADVIRRQVLDWWTQNNGYARQIAIDAYGSFPEAVRALWGSARTFRSELRSAQRLTRSDLPSGVPEAMRSLALQVAADEISVADALRRLRDGFGLAVGRLRPLLLTEVRNIRRQERRGAIVE